MVLSDEELIAHTEHIHVKDTWRFFWKSFDLFWWLFCLSLKVPLNGLFDLQFNDIVDLVNSSVSRGEQVAIVLPSAREIELEALMRGTLSMEHPAIPQLTCLFKGSFFENQGCVWVEG